MFLVPLLGVLGCKPDETTSPHGLTFAIAPADLGDAKAAGTGFDPADGDATGTALDNALPVFGTDAPLWETPQFVWGLMQRETVRSAGSCPSERIDDGARVYEGDCRSSFGYEFAGDVTTEDWTADGVDWERLEADVDVVGDVEGAIFERAALSGVVQRGIPEDGGVDAHYDINLRLSLLGYWEQRNAADPREDAWSEWAITGTAEETSGAWKVDVAVEIGGAGGMVLVSESLVEKSTCPIEVEGTASLAEGVTAVFDTTACDACANVQHGGGETLACQP